jgi:hypothetical protein
MRQPNYLHNGAHFDQPQLHNVMADQQSLLPIAHDAPTIGRDVMVPHVQPELESAELLLEMAQIPVVTHDYENGKSFTINYGTYDCFQHSSLILFIRYPLILQNLVQSKNSSKIAILKFPCLQMVLW